MESSNEIVRRLMDKSNKTAIAWVAIGKIRPNSENPRTISAEDMEGLKRSISDLPEMMLLRPCVVSPDGVIMGGNQRYAACVALGWDKIPVIHASNLTEAQLREFIVKDNLPFGDWDGVKMAEMFELEELQAWGMEWAEVFFEEEKEPEEPEAAKNMKHQKQIRLSYTESDYQKAKEMLSQIAETPEQSVWILLNMWERENNPAKPGGEK